MLPVIPHFANECLSDLNVKKNSTWPEVDKKFLNPSELNIVIQVNGKKKGIFKTIEELDEKTLISKITSMEEMKKIFKERKISKHIYVKNKLINFIIND